MQTGFFRKPMAARPAAGAAACSPLVATPRAAGASPTLRFGLPGRVCRTGGGRVRAPQPGPARPALRAKAV